MEQITSNHAGIQEWDNSHGIHIFRLHYSADPDKTPAWAERQRLGMAEDYYRQEFEIDFAAKAGARLYHFEDEATLCKSFPVPAGWTRYCALDPHPRVPHAFLWVAVDPWGDAYAYRELWPSRVYGKPGNTPEDDNRFKVREYIETVKWLESAANEENSETENIFARVIDYAARGFKPTSDDEDQRNIQQRYEDESRTPEINYPFIFRDAIKDREAGIELVNDWLKPKDIEHKGEWTKKSKLRIFEDRCPELIFQLRNNRWQQNSPQMAEKQDPSSKAMQKRNHLTDCLRYLCMNGLEYIPPATKSTSTWEPLAKGVAY